MVKWILNIHPNNHFWKYVKQDVSNLLQLILIPTKLKIWKWRQLSEEQRAESEDPQSFLIKPHMWES